MRARLHSLRSERHGAPRRPADDATLGTLESVDGPEHQSSTLIKLSSEAVHQRRRRAAGAGLLAIAAAAVWAITSLGGGSSNTARPNSFAAKVATIGGTGPASLMRKVNVRDSAAIDSVLQTTPYIVKGGGEKKADILDPNISSFFIFHLFV